ncbi:uncharacterized protein LOC122365887 [Amphibalanus amphitrite]|uniref:uncharacterized protein LOC122365887 n=1 Tax=Amphibalanus amphitrite TaxID=1232801 RepID=UPI001C9039A5|nr:uncharacterized protein LOC122365887 [Amphibalanus amphitrite]
MLKWLQGERRVGSGEPLLTDDPLATIAGRGQHRRRPQPVYSVTRVNPLYREGPTVLTAPDGRGDAELSGDYILPYSPAYEPPGSPEYARPVSAGDSAPGGDLDTERLSVTSAGPARRPARTPPPPPAPPPRRALQLRQSHGWAGLDVLKMDSEFVSGMSVNLARLRPKPGEERRTTSSRQRTARKAAVRRRPPSRQTLVANPEFVKSVVVTTISAQPAECPKTTITKNSEYVVFIGFRCRHTKSVAPPSSSNACPNITVELNPVFVKRISPNCRHLQDAPSHRDWTKSLPAPSFVIGSPSQAPSFFISSPKNEVPALRSSAPPLDTGPDSIVTDSLLVLTSPELSPAATLHPRPLTPALSFGDQLTPDHVLAQFSQVIANSRSVSLVRRAGSDARSSAGSSTGSVGSSQASRGSGRPDPALAAAPVAFVTDLWQRSGLRTNGRKLLVNEEGEEETWPDAGGRRPSDGRTPSPPVPPRLPISHGWLQRLAELPGLRPTPTVRAAEPLDPNALTAVVVEPAVATAPSGPASVPSGRHVKFAGADGDFRLGPPSLGAPEQQRLWNTYYGAGSGSGYGALQPAPLHLQEVKRAAGLHDRKVSEFTLDSRGASALKERAEASRRTRRLWRTAVVVLVLAALVGSIMLISWYCTKGRHLFGAL